MLTAGSCAKDKDVKNAAEVAETGVRQASVYVYVCVSLLICVGVCVPLLVGVRCFLQAANVFPGIR